LNVRPAISHHGRQSNCSYIDALIPASIGLLLLTSPRLFTTAQGDTFERTSKKLKFIVLD